MYEVVARNSWGTVSSLCPLCHKEEESYAHMQMWCEKTKEVQRIMAAHDRIATALLEGILKQNQGTRVHKWARVLVDRLGEYQDGRIAG